MKVTEELWIFNPTGCDVSLSDLGVKVPAGKTINVYAYNPYVKKEQVEKSMKDGAISKRLILKTIKIVNGPYKERPLALDNLKAAQPNTISARKTKTSIVVDQNSPVTEEIEEGFNEFADYGFDVSEAVKTKKEDGAVLVVQEKTKEEIIKAEPVKTEIITEKSKVDSPTTILVKETSSKFTDPTGPHAEAVSSSKSPYAKIFKQPETEKKKVLFKRADETNTTDDSIINMNKVETEFDATIITKDKSGAIIMKFKEIEKSKEPSQIKQEQTLQEPVKKGRGRPKGSKNKT